MTTLLIDSCIPVRFGSPGQRAAYGLRQKLGILGPVTGLVIDSSGNEWRTRSLLPQGDLFLGNARALSLESPTFLGRPMTETRHPLRATDLFAPLTAETYGEGWANDRRIAKLASHIAAMSPRTIIVADETLLPIVRRAIPQGDAVVVLSRAWADWHGHIACRIKNSEQSLWHRRLADFLVADAQAVPPCYEQQPYQDLLPAIEQERSDLFLTKFDTVMIPSTGNAWLDQMVIDLAGRAAQQQVDKEGAACPVIFAGFDNRLLENYPHEHQAQHWFRLHTGIGTSRALFMPCLTPFLAPLVNSALSVGTPVLLSHGDLDHFGLEPVEGMLINRFDLAPQLLNLAIARGVDDPAWYQAIASDWSVQTRAGTLATAGWQPSAAAKPENGDPCDEMVPVRLPPVIGLPTVLYNRASNMLLLRLQIRSESGVEDVRLLNGNGEDLTRLAPTAGQLRQAIYQLEGGLVIPLADLRGALCIECYCDTQKLHNIRIDVDDFELVGCELIQFDVSNHGISGAFWVDSSLKDARWQIDVNGEMGMIHTAHSVVIPDLDVIAIPFHAPMPSGATTHMSINLVAQNTGQLPQRPVQRTLYARQSQLAPAASQSPAIEALKDRHVGRRGWIVGNGPSVRLDDLARIPQDDVKFCFNRFYLSYDTNPLREDYVVSADTLMIKDFGQEMIDLSTGYPLFCIPPAETLDLRGDFALVPPGQVGLPLFSHSPDQYVSVGGSSVFVAIQMAWHMGIRELVFYGMDYSFSAKVVRDPRYAFPVSFDDGNHFIKGYRSAKPWCPPTWRDISAGFLNARVAFELHGGKVINATRGGKLELFPRQSFDEVIA